MNPLPKPNDLRVPNGGASYHKVADPRQEIYIL